MEKYNLLAGQLWIFCWSTLKIMIALFVIKVIADVIINAIKNLFKK